MASAFCSTHNSDLRDGQMCKELGKSFLSAFTDLAQDHIHPILSMKIVFLVLPNNEAGFGRQKGALPWLGGQRDAIEMPPSYCYNFQVAFSRG